MSDDNTVEFSPRASGRLQGGVLVVTIDNPPVNATSAIVRQGLIAAIRHAAEQSGISQVIITGAGRIFVGGADISEFGTTRTTRGQAAAYDDADESMRSRRRHERWMANLPSPLIRLEGDGTPDDRLRAVIAQLGQASR